MQTLLATLNIRGEPAKVGMEAWDVPDPPLRKGDISISWIHTLAGILQQPGERRVCRSNQRGRTEINLIPGMH